MQEMLDNVFIDLVATNHICNTNLYHTEQHLQQQSEQGLKDTVVANPHVLTRTSPHSQPPQQKLHRAKRKHQEFHPSPT